MAAGVYDPKAVTLWARGDRKPHPEAERRLRDAYYITRVLMESESAETVRAWFVGMNPELGDQSPAQTLAQDPTRVLQAARDFVAQGDR